MKHAVGIPRKFELLGQTVYVRFDPELNAKRDLWGVSIYRLNEIRIQPSTEGHRRAQDDVEQTFWHECMHFILNRLGEDELARNEALVDRIAGAIHQVITTATYEGHGESPCLEYRDAGLTNQVSRNPGKV